MKLYIANGTYVGTQADAKKLDKDFIPTEVPVDKEGLISYLNEYGRFNRATGRSDAEIETPAEPVIQRGGIELPTTLTDVETFIQAADHPQVASIFENVVLRTRELVTAPAAPGSLQDRMAKGRSEVYLKDNAALDGYLIDAGTGLTETPADDLGEYNEAGPIAGDPLIDGEPEADDLLG